MKYLGDFAANTTVRGGFNTRAKATGAPIAMAGSPVLSVYKDGNATQTTTGVVLTEGFDALTGHHLYAITTTDGFYTTGSDYRIVLTAGTVDGESVVGVEVGSFSIENRNISANVTQISGDSAAADTLELFAEALDQATGQLDSGSFASDFGDTGLTLPKAVEMLAAFIAGKVSRSSSLGVTTLTYKKRDGTTTSFTTVANEDDGDRDTTGSLS